MRLSVRVIDRVSSGREPGFQLNGKKAGQGRGANPALNLTREDRSGWRLLAVEKEMLWVDLEKARLAGYGHFANDPAKMLEFFGRFV